MKCGALVKYEMKGKKNPKPKLIRLFSRSYIIRANGVSLDTEGATVCDGDVKINIDVENDSGCCCCCSSSLSIEYKCDKCGNTDFQELPGLYGKFTIHDLLQQVIDNIDEPEHLKYLEKYENLEKELKEQTDKVLTKLNKSVKKKKIIRN